MRGGFGMHTWGFRFLWTRMKLPLYSLGSSPLTACTLATTCSATLPKKTKKREKVIVISGPTGAGKSRLALELAKRLNGEIISADSVQVYTGLDIGSAKPSSSERKEVPHHLIDILHPAEEYSVGQFFEDARKATEDVLEKGHVPIIAGGTGLYLRWYIYGKPKVSKASPEVASEAFTELIELQRSGDWDAAVDLVVKAGDSNAQYVPHNNWYRLKRSLEIIKSSGSPPSAFSIPYDSFKDQFDSRIPDPSQNLSLCGESGDALEVNLSKDLDYDFICFFLSSQRLDLYKRIDLRCEEMLLGSKGIMSEATKLLDLGLLPNLNPATRAIGYRQAMEYLLKYQQQGGSSTEELFSFLSEFQKVSRNFAKRQMTWFRNELIYHWLDASQPLEKIVDFIYDAYHDQSGNLVVPEYLQMKKHISSREEVSELKRYLTKNKHFVKHEDCHEILNLMNPEAK